MAGASPVGVGADPQTPQHQFPTPSPFSFSVASTRWSSRPSIHLGFIVLRFMAFLFSFVSALALTLAAPSSKTNHGSPSNFTKYPSLMYCFVVACLTFAYSAFRLLKGSSDFARRSIFISDTVSDYASFILDQMMGYLLISSSSVAIPVIWELQQDTPLWKASTIAAIFSFWTFVVLATCALLSGYKLCKRIIW